MWVLLRISEIVAVAVVAVGPLMFRHIAFHKRLCFEGRVLYSILVQNVWLASAGFLIWGPRGLPFQQTVAIATFAMSLAVLVLWGPRWIYKMRDNNTIYQRAVVVRVLMERNRLALKTHTL